MNYKDCAGESTFSYGQLSDIAKSKAKLEVFAREYEAYIKHKDAAKYKIKSNIHAAVNDRLLISRLCRLAKFLTRLSEDTIYMERFIIENLCDFLEDGTYITYMS